MNEGEAPDRGGDTQQGNDKGTIHGRIAIRVATWAGARQRDTTHLAYIDRHRRTARVGMFHVAFQVDVQKLEHEIELLVGVHDVQQPRPHVSTLAQHGRVSGARYLTILSSLSSFNKLISRMAVLGTPSSSASRRIFLSATIWLVVTSLAL